MSDGKWVRFRAAAYLTGRGITYGAADVYNPAATAPGKYSVNVSPTPNQFADVCDDSLRGLQDGFYDHVFVGRLIENSYDVPGLLRELAAKLRVGGHLIVHLPINAEGEYEHVKFTPDAVPGMVGEAGRFTPKDFYERDGYLLQIYKKLSGRKGLVIDPKFSEAHSRKRACIVRYGALGDMVMITPLIRQLRSEGFEVHMNITPYAQPIIEYNPFVSNVLIQEREIIPNADLGEYWAEWRPEYDRYINLSESIEGTLLKVEGRADFFTTKAFRHSKCDVNYYDHTMALGGYPDLTGTRGELYFTEAEERRFRVFRDSLKGKFIVQWALNGSSHHKVYPLMEAVMTEWLAEHQDACLVTVGDYSAKLLEFDHPRVYPRAGEWSIREALLMTKYANVVVGPETAMLNAAGCFDTPKITLLSHSTHNNLCRYWTNDYCLAPVSTACYPCHQLHYSKESCPLSDLFGPDGSKLATGPTCAMGGISGEALRDRLDEVYLKSHPD